MSDKARAPFTDEQIDSINAYQRDGRFHPFTCANDRSDEAHVAEAKASGRGDEGILVASREGLTCPACGYRQAWAHAGMARFASA